MLIGMQDIGVVLVQELAHRVDDPLAIGTGDEEDGGVLHGIFEIGGWK
jgi:hypothetical protein